MTKHYLVSKVTGKNDYGSVDMFILELDKYTIRRLRFMVWLSATIQLVLRTIDYIGQFFPLKGRVTPFRLVTTGFHSLRFDFWGTWLGDEDDSEDDQAEDESPKFSISEIVEDLLPNKDWGVFAEVEIEAKYPHLLERDSEYNLRGDAVKVWHDGDIFFTAYDKHSGDDYETYSIDAHMLFRALYVRSAIFAILFSTWRSKSTHQADQSA